MEPINIEQGANAPHTEPQTTSGSSPAPGEPHIEPAMLNPSPDPFPGPAPFEEPVEEPMPVGEDNGTIWPRAQGPKASPNCVGVRPTRMLTGALLPTLNTETEHWKLSVNGRSEEREIFRGASGPALPSDCPRMACMVPKSVSAPVTMPLCSVLSSHSTEHWKLFLNGNPVEPEILNAASSAALWHTCTRAANSTPKDDCQLSVRIAWSTLLVSEPEIRTGAALSQTMRREARAAPGLLVSERNQIPISDKFDYPVSEIKFTIKVAIKFTMKFFGVLVMTRDVALLRASHAMPGRTPGGSGLPMSNTIPDHPMQFTECINIIAIESGQLSHNDESQSKISRYMNTPLSCSDVIDNKGARYMTKGGNSIRSETHWLNRAVPRSRALSGSCEVAECPTAGLPCQPPRNRPQHRLGSDPTQPMKCPS